MKVLFICFQVPYPLLKGYQARAYSQIKMLSEKNQVDVIALEYAPLDKGAIAQVEKIASSFRVVRHRKRDLIWNVVCALFSLRPFQTSLFKNQRLNWQVSQSLQDEKYDLVHLQMLRLGNVLDVLTSVPTVVDYIDALSKNMLRRAHFEKWPLSTILRIEGHRLARYERKVTHLVDRTLIVSTSDAKTVGGTRPPAVVPLGIDLEKFRFHSYKNRSNLIFCGNLSYFPNERAALYLMSEVLPRVWKVYPELRLILAGAFPSAEITKNATDRRIEITGFVDDLAAHIAKAAIAVFPMQSGSGMQFKILEAMAIGTPIITSSIAMSAFPDSGQTGLAEVADSLDDIVHAICNTLSRPDDAIARAKAARAWVELQYSWESASEQLVAQYKEVLAT